MAQIFRCTLGEINNIKLISRLAHSVGALVLVDASQSMPSIRVGRRVLKKEAESFFRKMNYNRRRQHLSRLRMLQVDVKDLEADWVVGSGHKMYGPTGIGFLWGRYELLKSMIPFKGGGDMIRVTIMICDSF